MGFGYCCVGILGKRSHGSINFEVEEPLLNSAPPKGEESVTPYAKAGIFSHLTFSWMNPLISLGYEKNLDLEDVPQLADPDSVKGSFAIFDDKLESYRRENNTITAFVLAKGLLFTALRPIALSAFCALLSTLASYVGPYLIANFVEYLNGQRHFKNEGYILAVAFVVAKLVECFGQRYWFFLAQQGGFRARCALVSTIYNKGLTLSCQSKQGQTTGEIINFMAVDADRIGDFAWSLHDVWLAVIQILLALAILYKDVGLASVTGFVATFIVMLLNVPLANLQNKFQGNLMKTKDERMMATSEVLKNMRILKLQAWETKFLEKIIDIRNVEANWLKKYLYTGAATIFFFWVAPTIISVLTFGSCILMGIPLESAKILSAIATFRILQQPIYHLPDTINIIVQTKVSLDRIASFLSLDDLQVDVVEKLPAGSSDKAVEVISGNFNWEESSSTPTLKNINLEVFHGMRVAICGTVGSGKSSLLSCLLGEMTKISGTIRICGSKAYVPQSPWIQSGAIQENILFSKAMDSLRYNRILEACALKEDLEVLPFGDKTVIGERGINLSGGQKQRIQIARALYQDADIYLFDDPFSAVDAHTGTHLFSQCILGFLSSKTVIYVTHQVDFLPYADLILVMKDGQIKEAGKYNELLKSGTDFIELIEARQEALSSLDLEIRTTSEQSSFGHGKSANLHKQESLKDRNEGKEQLVQEEEREKGSVGLSVYWNYITTAYKGLLFPFALLSQVMNQIFQISGIFWMAWATPVSKDMAGPVENSTLILVYLLLSIGSAICLFIRGLLVVTMGYKTANMLFSKMLNCIFHAPMSFFDSTPSARILNRVSTDQSAVDMNIARLVGATAFALIQIMGIIAVMSQIAWQVFIIFIPMVAICIMLQRYYIACARELSRLVGVCNAPVIQHFSETLLGSSTIRSFDQQPRFQELSMKFIDAYTRPRFHTSGAMEWLCIRLDMVSLVTYAFSMIFLVSVPVGTIEPSVAGLAVTTGLTLNTLQMWSIWNLCDMENRMISVERILQYSKIPSEPPLLVESNKPESNWPTQGEVSIQDLQVRYGPHLPLVLRGLTCTFLGGKKTGIVGRTGSGKSTLIQTLFRLVEPSAGRILIDGVDIVSIGLGDLRSRLSIIPQDPTMFKGTIRSNLDPLEEYTDDQIWVALDKCQLGDEVRQKPEKLDSPVSENGENWSVGQRQLVCLGRVLLKKRKVLVLDEATASVDTSTDNLIQQTLNQHFSNSTVITIAHRITSVIGSHMVLLLDNGLLKEYDAPERLLQDKSSSFAKLVAEYSMRSSCSYENANAAV